MEKVNQNILNIIRAGKIQDNIFKLIYKELDRKTYLEVDKVLKYMGGKWNRKLKGHLFSKNPTDKIKSLILTGEIVNEKKLFQFFETPKELAKKMINIAEIKDSDILLEPSAGQGAIADLFPKINKSFFIEIDKTNVNILKEKGYDVIEGDFLKYDDRKFDKIIMNPPFTKQKDIEHIVHAYDLLNKNGKIVTITSLGWTFKTNKKSIKFRKLVEKFGNYEYLDSGIFKKSGTNVKTVLVSLNKVNLVEDEVK